MWTLPAPAHGCTCVVTGVNSGGIGVETSGKASTGVQSLMVVLGMILMPNALYHQPLECKIAMLGRLVKSSSS